MRRCTSLTLLCLALLAGCAPAPTAPPASMTASIQAPSAITPATPVAPQLTPTPGILLRGRVLLGDGSGLANVSICRNFASYPGTVIATTDQAGNYQAAFAFIPGDEMVGVWANAAGYTFDPPAFRWRHYFGLEDRSLDFRATPASSTAVPPAPCS